MNIIQVKNLSVRYMGFEALSNISFDIASGEYIGIVGPNGSGKTTLIRALLGLVPYEGEARFRGEPLSGFMKKSHIGYLPQKMSFLDQRFPATAEEIVFSGVYCCKKFPKRLTVTDKRAGLEAMKTLGIMDLKGRPIGKLSGGQQQRVLLARALVHSPEVLILDEPTAALDPKTRENFYETVKKLNKEKKVTVLLVSHDSGTIGKYASKLLYLDRQIVFYGSFDEFCASPAMSKYFGAGQHIICHRH